jgi:hypothetical protein
LDPALRNRALPPTLDHSVEAAFRPVYNSTSPAPAGATISIGYHFTFERNQLYGYNGSDPENQCSPLYINNFLNGGSGQGYLPSDCYALAKEIGCAHVSDFNFTTSSPGGNTLWMSGYEGYYMLSIESKQGTFMQKLSVVK